MTPDAPKVPGWGAEGVAQRSRALLSTQVGQPNIKQHLSDLKAPSTLCWGFFVFKSLTMTYSPYLAAQRAAM